MVFKILLFLLAGAAGFYAMPLTVILAEKSGQFPHLPQTSPLFHQFGLWLTAGSLAWLAGLIAGLGWFFAARREMRLWLLCAPLFLPALYTLLVLVYFNTARAG